MSLCTYFTDYVLHVTCPLVLILFSGEKKNVCMCVKLMVSLAGSGSTLRIAISLNVNLSVCMSNTNG